MEHTELKSCDRCLLRCSRIFWSSSNGEQSKSQKSNQKDAKQASNEDDQQPGTSQGYFLTAGQLLETSLYFVG